MPATSMGCRAARRTFSLCSATSLNIWIIQIVVAIGPPLGGLIFTVYMKTDWGISLFFLTPLALVAIPSLRLQKIALFHIAAIWLVITLAALVASPYIAAREMAENPNAASGYGARSELARELTQAWQTRFHSRWAVVAGTTEVGEPMTFYSPDHPAPFTPGEIWSSGLTSLEEAKRLGFIGICDTTDGRLPVCEAWMAANANNAERLAIATQRFFHGHPGPAISWKVYIAPPRSEEHTSELQSRLHLVCRLLLEKKKKMTRTSTDSTRKDSRDPTSRFSPMHDSQRSFFF